MKSARIVSLKTNHPLILTARISESDLKPFDLLRQAHFPPHRNFLGAHMTMFHRLPGEYVAQIVEELSDAVKGKSAIVVEVAGLRHLGAGVAFTIESPELHMVHARLKAAFGRWLGPQDGQKWQPHITIQNKVSRSTADSLYQGLTSTFRPHPITIVGLDLWKYLNGPWKLENSVMFETEA
jgi:hypothetical protein